MEGYIRLHRCIFKWEWWSDPPTRDVFLYCLLKANWKDMKFQGEEIKRGSFVTSYPKICAGTGVSIQQARTAIKHLKSTGELTVRTTSKYSVITIQNYDKYQVDNSQGNSQSTGNQQAINNKRKNIISKKENNNSSITYKDTYTRETREVVAYLNEKLGTHYKPTTQKTVQLIKARLSEDFTVEDFQKVIDTKYADWKDDERLSKYLRPDTLFSNKFEGYLNQISPNDEESRKKDEAWQDDIARGMFDEL